MISSNHETISGSSLKKKNFLGGKGAFIALLILKFNESTVHTLALIFLYILPASPPRPGRPYLIKAQSTSITIGWPEICAGGHSIRSYTIRYDRTIGYYSYRYIRGVNPAKRNYTITGLESNTQYSFQVQVVSPYSRTSTYSFSLSISTLPPGMFKLCGMHGNPYYCSGYPGHSYDFKRGGL